MNLSSCFVMFCATVVYSGLQISVYKLLAVILQMSVKYVFK